MVVEPDGGQPSFGCELLQTSPLGGPAVEAGDRVVVLPPAEGEPLGVVLGRLGSARTAERIKIQAGQAVELVCGRGSIVLRADGRIVIKGVEVASVAEATQRIVGAVVEVN